MACWAMPVNLVLMTFYFEESGPHLRAYLPYLIYAICMKIFDVFYLNYFVSFGNSAHISDDVEISRIQDRPTVLEYIYCCASYGHISQ